MPPKPKPRAVHELTGNPSRRKENLKFDLIEGGKIWGVPDPPDHLNEHAKRMWHECCREFTEKGLLDTISLPMFESMCFCFGLMRDAEIELSIAPADKRKMYSQERNENYRIFYQLAGLFGLSPADRVKFKAPDVTEESDFDRLKKGM
jgi:phage terminase small subunit